uniref:Uncharacterized protein n=1 Tax=Panagrolaimus sp. JU765 TaxID=591449 RepID=A0AC34R655_9BILA
MSEEEEGNEFEYFRDRDPKVRSRMLDNCIERINNDLNQINVDDLKLVTIGLDDSLLAIRLKCINILQTLLEEAENIPRI